VGHAHLYENAQRWRPSPANVQTLEELLERAGQDPARIIREIYTTRQSSNEWVGNILATATRVHPHKRREYLEAVILSWKKQYNDHSFAVPQWKSELDIFRESTYISCWNRASSTSLAMWEMYGGGNESVAVRSTFGKLEQLLKDNASFLERESLAGDLAEVEYLEGLKNPDERVQERIYETIFERDRDFRLGLFAIKPSVYEFEHEVRAILYPKRDLLAPIDDPHPSVTGFALPINPDAQDQGMQPLVDFIESVYVHPLLHKDSLMVRALTEINRRFDADEIPIVADRIEALGSDVTLP
jgi:hypothetical protein